MFLSSRDIDFFDDDIGVGVNVNFAGDGQSFADNFYGT